MSRKQHWLALAVLVLLIIPACQPYLTPAARLTPRGTAESTTLEGTAMPDSQLGVAPDALRGVTIEAWHPWFGAEASLFESQVAEFNAGNPWGIQVNAAGQGNYAMLFDSVTAVLNLSNMQPDMVIALPEHALAWDEQEAVVDLNEYIHNPLWGLDQADIDDFPGIFWAQDEIGDRQVGLPAQRSARFLLYNQTWARELGFDDPPATFTEFYEQACRANQAMRSDTTSKNDNTGGWFMDADPMTVLAWMQAFGGGILEQGNYRFLTPDNIAAFQSLKVMYDSGCAWQSNETTRFEAFARRAALFATADLAELPDQTRAFSSAGNADEWTVLSFPGPEKQGVVIYGSSYIMLKSTDLEQLAAWLFIRWMLSPQEQTRWILSTGLFPTRTSSLASLKEYRSGHPQWAEAIELVSQGQLQPQLASWQLVKIILGDGFNYIFRYNQPAGRVAAILADLDRTVSGLIDQK